MSVSRFPTNRGFALALPLKLITFALALLIRSVFAIVFGLSFPFALNHGMDLHEVIVSGMVSSWGPISFGHGVFDGRVLDTGIRGCRT